MKAINWKNDPVLQAVFNKRGEDYELLEYLGGGGFSKVYRVRHKHFVEDRALKIMDSNYILQKLEKQKIKDIKKEYNKTKERFINEAILCKTIEHENIVKIFDVG